MKEHIYLEERNIYEYPDSESLYSPSTSYPEYIFELINKKENQVYDMVRNCFCKMGLDIEHYNQRSWNPLGEYIKPGETVLLKPNMVKHYDTKEQYECTLTHPSIIRAVLDYCIIAGAGRIILGDAPIQGADMDKICNDCHYEEMIQFYWKRGYKIELIDFRDLIVKRVNNSHIVLKEKNPYSEEYVTVHMGKLSHHYQIEGKRRSFATCGYPNIEINKLHHDEIHDYIVSAHALSADIIINLPKPKTHRFAGITAAEKNFVGICSDKESLPHYILGGRCIGGDETNKYTLLSKIISFIYEKRLEAGRNENKKLEHFYWILYYGLKKIQRKDIYMHGQWYGNNTIWKTIIDLNKILLFADKEGNLDLSKKKRKILTIGDMIIVGEKAGPLEPTPKPLGMIMISDNCAVFDYVVCKIAGYDEQLIPTVFHSIRDKDLSCNYWKDIELYSNNMLYDGKKIQDLLFEKKHWEPHPFWKEILQ